MGSFNVTCGISKIPIRSDDPIVYIPLNMSERLNYENKLDGGQHHLVYPWVYYKPLTLPIIGFYGGCGDINNIEIDNNVKIIEEYFKISIENFLDIGEQPKEIHSAMFIHKNIYDYFINNLISDLGEREPVYKIKDKYLIYYNKMNISLNVVGDLHKKCLEMYKDEGYTEEQKEVILNSLMSVKEYNNPFKLDNQEFLSRTFQKIYNPVIKKGLLKDQFVDFMILNLNMFSTNSYYGPTVCGEQYGNYFAIRDLYNEALKIVEKNIRERVNNGIF